MTINPYESPQNPSQQYPSQPPIGPYVPCPQCQGQAKLMGFTWWGGVLGPWLFTHVACGRCGHQYNGKTGQTNSTAIAIYLGVGIVLGLALGVVIAVSRL